MSQTDQIDGVEVRPIPGMEGFYSIARDGRVWSHSRLVHCMAGGGRRQSPGLRWLKGRWLKPLFKDGIQSQEVCIRGETHHVNVMKALRAAWDIMPREAENLRTS